MLLFAKLQYQKNFTFEALFKMGLLGRQKGLDAQISCACKTNTTTRSEIIQSTLPELFMRLRRL